MDLVTLAGEGSWAAAWNWLLSLWTPGMQDGLWGAVAFGLLFWLGRRLLAVAAGAKARLYRNWADPMEGALQHYQGQLDERVEKLGHKFAKGLRLSQILVPVSVEALPTNDDAKRVQNPGSQPASPNVPRGDNTDRGKAVDLKLGVDNLSAILIQVFARATAAPEGSPPRKREVGAPFVVITGAPGSGKTVALKVAAMEGWDLPRPAARPTDRRKLIPVLLTFKQFHKFGLNLNETIVQALRELDVRWPPVLTEGAEKTDPVAEWVGAALREGRLLVLIDGLDELEQMDRAKAAAALREAVDNLKQTPFVVTCRTEAWRDLRIEHPRRTWLQMQRFNDAAIRQFVRRWQFEPAELAERLLAGIRHQTHLTELAQNPLTLTILCWLYENKRDAGLPDNRALFYKTCCDQLLGDWDLYEHQIQRVELTKDDKESFLAFVAWHHMGGPLTGESAERVSEKGADMERNDYMTTKWVKETAKEWGKQRGWSPHDINIVASSLQIEDGVIVSTLPDGILVALPPSKLTFSHRTFMEYFAALHLLHEMTLDNMLSLIASDPGRWREVLLFYCGLCTRSAEVSRVVDALIGSKQVALALTALSEAPLADPVVAARVLDLARRTLMVGFHPEIARGLGDLLTCSHPGISQQASELLDELLERVALRTAEPSASQLHEMARAQLYSDPRVRQIAHMTGRSEWLLARIGDAPIAERLAQRSAPLPINVLDDLVLTMLRRPSALVQENLPRLLRRLDPAKILPAMPEGDTASLAASLSAGVMRLNPQRSSEGYDFQLEWIDGLRRARALPILFDLETQSRSEPQLDRAIAVALARSSTLDDRFWTLADKQPKPQYRSSEEIAADARWGWPYRPPIKQQGRSLCCRVAGHLSQDLSWATKYQDLDTETDIDTRLKYLALARGVEARSDPNESGLNCSWAVPSSSPGVLRAIWARAAKVRGASSGLRVNDLDLTALRTLGLALNSLLTCLLLGSMLLPPFGLSDLGVSWPGVLSGLFVGVAVLLAGAMASMISDWSNYMDRQSFVKLAAQPSIVWSLFTHLFIFSFLSLVQGIVESIAGRGDDPINCWPSASSSLRVIAVILSSAAPLGILAAFSVGGTGQWLLLLLMVLALVNPFYLLTYSAEATHPLFPSNNTLHLIDLLSWGQAKGRRSG